MAEIRRDSPAVVAVVVPDCHMLVEPRRHGGRQLCHLDDERDPANLVSQIAVFLQMQVYTG